MDKGSARFQRAVLRILRSTLREDLLPQSGSLFFKPFRQDAEKSTLEACAPLFTRESARLQKCSVLLLCIFLLLGLAFARADEVTSQLPTVPAAAPVGSIQPWNGRDLDGWTFIFKDPKPADPNKAWHAENGVLSFAAKVSGYLRTEKTFSNYHLHVEYRWTEKIVNSGIFVHVREPDVIWPNSVQINLKLNATGDLIPQGGFQFNGSAETAKKSGEFNEKPAGEWNGCDIFCREDSIEVFINGERKNFVEKLSANSGFIALQLEGAPIEFRNLWLQSLSSDFSKKPDEADESKKAK